MIKEPCKYRAKYEENRGEVSRSKDRVGDFMRQTYPTDKIHGAFVSRKVAAFAVVLQRFLELEGKDDPATWHNVSPLDMVQLLSSRVKRLAELDLEVVAPKELFDNSLLVACCAMVLAEQSSLLNEETKPGLRNCRTPSTIRPAVTHRRVVASKAS